MYQNSSVNIIKIIYKCQKHKMLIIAQILYVNKWED